MGREEVSEASVKTVGQHRTRTEDHYISACQLLVDYNKSTILLQSHIKSKHVSCKFVSCGYLVELVLLLPVGVHWTAYFMLMKN